MKIIEVKHPLVQHKIGLMREKNISTKSFRELAKELANLLTYEATADFELETVEIEGWNGQKINIQQLQGRKVTVVPILRAGLGMMEGVLEHLPAAKVSVVGFYRDEETAKPVPYYAKLCKDIDERVALVIDPMLATGGTMVETIKLLKAKNCKDIKVLTFVSAPEGIANLNAHHPDVALYTAAIDERLDTHFYIVPGLGDAGDKIFGTI